MRGGGNYLARRPLRLARGEMDRRPGRFSSLLRRVALRPSRTEINPSRGLERWDCYWIFGSSKTNTTATLPLIVQLDPGIEKHQQDVREQRADYGQDAHPEDHRRTQQHGAVCE